MKVARGIDPGPEGKLAVPDPKLYLKHVPTIDISRERGPGVARRLVGIAGWAVMSIASQRPLFSGSLGSSLGFCA